MMLLICFGQYSGHTCCEKMRPSATARGRVSWKALAGGGTREGRKPMVEVQCSVQAADGPVWTTKSLKALSLIQF